MESTKDLEVGNQIVDCEHINRGVGEVSSIDSGAVGVLFEDNRSLVVYPSDRLELLAVV